MSNGGRRVIVTIDESEVSLEVLEWVNSHSILLPDDDVTVALAINEDFSKIAGPGGWQAEGGGGLDAVRNYRETIIEFERRGQRSLDQAVSAIEKTGVVSKKKKKKKRMICIHKGFIWENLMLVLY